MRRRGRTQQGWELFGIGGARIGTVVAVRPHPDTHNPAWLLVRLAGLRRRLRAIPASEARWLPPGRLTVPYPVEQVSASPAASDEDALLDDAWRLEVNRFYRDRLPKVA